MERLNQNILESENQLIELFAPSRIMHRFWNLCVEKDDWESIETLCSSMFVYDEKQIEQLHQKFKKEQKYVHGNNL